MKKNNVYESDDIRCVTGNTLRPGGFLLTNRAVLLCDISKGQKVLDVGCGMGATVDFLKSEFKIDAYGIDPSQKLIDRGREVKNLPIIKGIGESIPYNNKSFDVVFTECTLSLMQKYEDTLQEIYRVLKPGGFVIISDVFAKEPDYIDELKNSNVQTCLRGLLDIGKLLIEIEKRGFEVITLEDWTSLLKQLMVDIIFKYDSMDKFWNVTTCENCSDFKTKLSLCKPGYFFMIAKKGD
ncbi:DVU_1556 family methyltransferase [Tepidibacter aestuarii]|uniref:DVU_1556 family methyltransferase n=1 Tax=Tepidibacter aestuarii TaxID=2925782 RepID=UPI0020C09417|nr:class I SAM-dependent methyltransferase [Tepidibacter aestuarii]CAH2213316.1 Methyltransferase domain-containing protein [Tepidibacter aestuarii]